GEAAGQVGSEKSDRTAGAVSSGHNRGTGGAQRQTNVYAHPSRAGKRKPPRPCRRVATPVVAHLQPVATPGRGSPTQRDTPQQQTLRAALSEHGFAAVGVQRLAAE